VISIAFEIFLFYFDRFFPSLVPSNVAASSPTAASLSQWQALLGLADQWQAYLRHADQPNCAVLEHALLCAPPTAPDDRLPRPLVNLPSSGTKTAPSNNIHRSPAKRAGVHVLDDPLPRRDPAGAPSEEDPSEGGEN